MVQVLNDLNTGSCIPRIQSSTIKGLGLGSDVISDGQCFSGDMEVMTERGWLRLSSYTGQRVLQVVGNDFAGEFVNPLVYEERDFKGVMVECFRQNLKFKASPDIDILYLKGDLLHKRSLKDMPSNLGTGLLPVVATNVSGLGIDLTDNQLRLNVAIMADGCIVARKTKADSISFGFKKERKIKRLKELLDQEGIEYRVTCSDDGTTYFYFKAVSWIVGKRYPKEWVGSLSYSQRMVILSEIVHWDGYLDDKAKRVEFSSKYLDECEFIQSLAETCGFRSSISRKINKTHILYMTRIMYTTEGIKWSGVDTCTQNVLFDGKVFRIKVPSGNIMMRYKGCTSVLGDSSLLEIKKEPSGNGFDLLEVKKQNYII